MILFKTNKAIVFLVLVYCVYASSLCYAQSETMYSAVNPVFALYSSADVELISPTKYQNGANVFTPDPVSYPWEATLENGMPNVVVNPTTKHLTIYMSSYLIYATVPPSRVGMVAYVNASNTLDSWSRPDCNLYYYNSAGATSDDKITPEYNPSYQSTNIPAVDIESVGIYVDDLDSHNPIKLLYLPQRESHNAMIASYSMANDFKQSNIFDGFTSMKNDRVSSQAEFTFDFINGDTHMNFIKKDGVYSFVSRLNAKRSYLLPDETLPLEPDNRYRYRRETISEVGSTIETKNVELGIALDMSTVQWEPYGMQPFQLLGFENDIWWGLVTVYGTETASAEYRLKQRTELAYSLDGKVWKYIKPGVPFLDNGTATDSDDYGTINIAKPVRNTNFSDDPNDLYYFYAASNARHIPGDRSPGVSVAVGKAGKYAALTSSGSDVKTFLSMSPKSHSEVAESDMVRYSISNAFNLGTDPCPSVLSDVTMDPRGQDIQDLDSYVNLAIHEYDSTVSDGIGDLLISVLGSSIEGTASVSDNYEKVGFVKDGNDASTKYYILEYLREYSQDNPSEIVSFKDFGTIPVIISTSIKNAKYYGIQLSDKKITPTYVLDVSSASNFDKGNDWSYIPTTTSDPYAVFDFSNIVSLPNQTQPVDKTTGVINATVIPSSGDTEQTVVRMWSNDDNHMGIYYLPNGSFEYRMVKDGILFSTVMVSPDNTQEFVGKECEVYLEAVKNADRKFAKTEYPEEAVVLTVSCPSAGFERSSQQNIIWNWKHSEGSITDSDRANARAFAYLQFASFIPEITTISVGGNNTASESRFVGSINKVDILNKLD